MNVSKTPPLFHAVERRHLEIVRRLVYLEAIDINQTVWRKSALFIAIENGYLEVAKLLLEQGSRLDVNSKTLLGDTALSLAAARGYLDIIELLLKDDQLDVAATNRFGETGLRLAPNFFVVTAELEMLVTCRTPLKQHPTSELLIFFKGN